MLAWLNVIAGRGQPVSEIVTGHWQQYGRNYYSRHDYEGVNAKQASADGRIAQPPAGGTSGTLLDGPESPTPTTSATRTRSTAPSATARASGSVSPTDRGSSSASGTGTVGATLRVYLESYEPEPARQLLDPQIALAPLIRSPMNWRTFNNKPAGQHPTSSPEQEKPMATAHWCRIDIDGKPPDSAARG